jgi:osmotically-inducible protein OsmY
MNVTGLALDCVNVVMEVSLMGILQTNIADTRSKDDVVQAAKEQLGRSSSQYVRGLVCDYCDGILVLRGRVPSYYHKQVAQEAVKMIEGVDRVINDTEVIKSVP